MLLAAVVLEEPAAKSKPSRTQTKFQPASICFSSLLLPRRPLSTSSGDLTDAKLISTLFLLCPHRLTSFFRLITPSVALFSIRRISNPSSALRLLSLLSSELHVGHCPSSYCHVIALLARSNLGADALKVLDEMAERRCTIESSFIDFLLSSFVKSGDLNSCLRLVSRAVGLKIRIGTYAFNNLLGTLISRNRAQDAIFLFREQLGLQIFAPDTCSFNSVINACCRVGDVDGAFGFFKRMGEFGCVADTITHNVLIDGLCKANMVDRGCDILRGVSLDGSCLLNVKSYTSVISGFCKLGRMEEANKVFEEMVESGIKPSRITYNVLIDGYGKVCDLKAANLVYERMRICGCSPDVVTYTSLIHGYCRSGQVDDAMRILHEMGGKEVRPNAYTFSIIIDSFCKKNRLKEAREILRELNGRKDILPHAFIYNPVIDGFCKAGDVEEANSILGEMEERGCRPDKHTYTILIIGHCVRGRMSEAIGLFNKMVATGCAPDSIAVNNFVSLLLKAGMPSEAKRIVEIASGKNMGLDLSLSKEIPSLLTKRADVSVAV
ncbi:uncharacterized protein A4U43_C06F4330 [Asparagus officinalis]|uniref:Pentacotripeptide-repeat region of PRORP domain-containing protein n=2 Tax=Asparagus officinalis TaxID=4686 RepID=A0A5P1EJH0_ASPOF|nr:uncharacterized protein A4U43_C06F4330 [Asparagus officinalis]